MFSRTSNPIIMRVKYYIGKKHMLDVEKIQGLNPNLIG